MARIASDLLNYSSKYKYDNGVLINFLNIRDQESLENVERNLTNLKLTQLYANPNLSLKGSSGFTVNHYLEIHKFLFDKIYPFAGEIRSEAIKKTIPFCLPNFIYSNLNEIMKKMNKYANRVNSRDDLLNFIVYFYPVLDLIHPFMEGNGRCEREFFRQYIKHICDNNLDKEYYLDFSLIEDKNDFINAVIDADICADENHLRNIFDKILIESSNELKK